MKLREHLEWFQQHPDVELLDKLAEYRDPRDLTIFRTWLTDPEFGYGSLRAFGRFLGRSDLKDELHQVYCDSPEKLSLEERNIAAVNSADYLIDTDTFRWFIVTYPEDLQYLAVAYEAIGCHQCALAVREAGKKAWPPGVVQTLNGYERLDSEGEGFLHQEEELFNSQYGETQERLRAYILENWRQLAAPPLPGFSD